MNFDFFLRNILVPVMLATVGFLAVALLDTYATKADVNTLRESIEWQKTILSETHKDVAEIKRILIEQKNNRSRE